MLKFPDTFGPDASNKAMLEQLDAWKIIENTEGQSYLCKGFEFENFPDCIRFMEQLVSDIESLDHHPNWTNSHANLHIELTTWDAGKIVSLKDFKVAYLVDYHFNRFY